MLTWQIKWGQLFSILPTIVLLSLFFFYFLFFILFLKTSSASLPLIFKTLFRRRYFSSHFSLSSRPLFAASSDEAVDLLKFSLPCFDNFFSPIEFSLDFYVRIWTDRAISFVECPFQSSLIWNSLAW